MICKTKPVIAIFIFLLQLNSLLFCQPKQLITGVISDKKTKENLPFSSLRLKNHPVGTISNEKGDFQFLIPLDVKNDTLIISHIGYEEFMIDINSVKAFLNVKLRPKSIVLDEAVISPLSPEDYIKRAVNKIKTNYSFEPFQTISYYSEELTENTSLLHKWEAVFKTYYPKSHNSAKNQHQLLLCREPGDFKKLAFMRDWFEKQERKNRKKMEKEEKEIPPDDDTGPKIDLGGPETILSFDLTKGVPAFLDSNQFKEFRYFIGESTTYQGRKLITIHFKSKGKVEMDDSNVNMRQQGDILLDLESDAIVLVEHSGVLVIPFVARPVLMAIGLRIKDPVFSQTFKYELFEGKWYPKDFHWNANVKLAKHHTFKPNEFSYLGVKQVFFVNEIKTDGALPVLKEKIFDPAEKIEKQVYKEEHITWKEINVLKN